MMMEIGKLLIVVGFICIGVGILCLLLPKLPWLGKLPGDILIKKENFTFYFPLATSIVLSVLLTIIMMFLTRR
jgi:hypothetical protein